MSNEDHLSNPVAIEVALTESGLSGKTQSRAMAALDRLGGALFDLPAARLEGLAQRIRDKDRLTSASYDAAVDVVTQRLGSDADTGRLVEGLIASHIRAIANRKHVVRSALEHLSPSAPSPDSEASVESDADELDADWLNYFGEYADKATAERVRDLWGRVLAGEIRHPGSFSLMTLRTLAELDQQMAEWFQAETEFRVGGQYILQPDRLEGEQLMRLSFLEEAGLLHQPSAMGVRQGLEPNSDGFVGLAEGRLCLRARVDGETSFRVIPITRVGREIASIFPPVDSLAVLRRVAEVLRNKVKTLEICTIISRKDGDVVLSKPIETLKP